MAAGRREGGGAKPRSSQGSMAAKGLGAMEGAKVIGARAGAVMAAATRAGVLTVGAASALERPREGGGVGGRGARAERRELGQRGAGYCWGCCWYCCCGAAVQWVRPVRGPQRGTAW